MDCLARKQRGIASKLGATAGTNKTGINLTPSRAKIQFGSIRKGYYWDAWLMLMMMTIFTLCRNKNNPVPQRDLQPRITVWRGSSYFIFKFYCCQRREQTSLADLLTSSQFQYHLKLRNIFNTTHNSKKENVFFNWFSEENKRSPCLMFDAINWLHYNYLHKRDLTW